MEKDRSRFGADRDAHLAREHAGTIEGQVAGGAEEGRETEVAGGIGGGKEGLGAAGCGDADGCEGLGGCLPDDVAFECDLSNSRSGEEEQDGKAHDDHLRRHPMRMRSGPVDSAVISKPALRASAPAKVADRETIGAAPSGRANR